MLRSVAHLPHVVVVGAGFGGLQAAKLLAKAHVRVTVVDRENHHLFQPLLYQVATAGLSPGSIAVPIRSVLGRFPNVQVLLGTVVDVDTDERRVKLRDGAVLEYDYLVLATGTRTNYYGHDDWEPHARGLKSLRDAIGIRERILLAFESAERQPDKAVRAALLTFVVIGGGPTGVEMAGAIAELGKRVLAKDFRHVAPADVRVVLVEMADRVLTPFRPDLSASAKSQLEQLGVDVMLGEAVTSVDHKGVQVGDQFIPSAVVCWASGVQAEPLVEQVGLALDRMGRARVDSHCAALGHPNVFAIGDVACFVPEGGESPLPGLAPVAIQQGAHVAKCIKHDLRRKPRPTFKYVDKGMMATIGRRHAVAQADWLPPMSGVLAWLAWSFVHILFLIGFHNRFIVFFEWVWSYFTFGRGARLITAHVSSVENRPAIVDERP